MRTISFSVPIVATTGKALYVGIPDSIVNDYKLNHLDIDIVLDFIKKLQERFSIFKCSLICGVDYEIDLIKGLLCVDLRCTKMLLDKSILLNVSLGTFTMITLDENKDRKLVLATGLASFIEEPPFASFVYEYELTPSSYLQEKYLAKYFKREIGVIIGAPTKVTLSNGTMIVAVMKEISVCPDIRYHLTKALEKYNIVEFTLAKRILI